MTPAQADSYRFDVLDLTKVWPQTYFPLIPVRKLVLNLNPVNYFQETE
jgi:catalase